MSPISLDNFIKNYKKFKSGYNHKLIICFKNLDYDQIQNYKYKLKDIKCSFFIDPETSNDFEWGSLKRVCEKYGNYIFFLNDHSYPVVHNWLNIVVQKIKKKSIVGCSSSFSSHFSNSFKRHSVDNYLQAIIKIIIFFFFFPKFPNPHLRTTGFLIYSNDFLHFFKNRNVKSKFGSLVVESGYKSMTNFFLKKKFNIKVVNNRGKMFDLEKSKFSETFAYKNQNGVIISDNQIREYLSFNKKMRQKKNHQVWGSI